MPSREHRPQDPLVTKRFIEPEFSLSVQDCHLRAGLGAARRAIDDAGPALRPVPVNVPVETTTFRQLAVERDGGPES